MDKVDQTIEAFKQKAVEVAATKFHHLFNFMSVRCESPIEKMLLAAVIYALEFDSDHETHPYLRPFKFQKSKFAPYEGIYYCTQGEVDRFRVDMLFRVVSGYDPHQEISDRWLAVECDGHDFHERTKHQARRDRSRDREMANLGITVLRFTGQEIHEDAERCAWEIEGLICRLMGFETE